MTATTYTDYVRGKYRIRTWLRGHSPWSLAERIPKGEDCGAHEWYRQSAELDGCYHCRVTRPHEAMTPDQELLADLALSCALWIGMGRVLRTLDIGQTCKLTLPSRV